MTERRDLPLVGWGDVLRAARLRPIRLRRRFAVAVAGIALIGITIAVPPPPRMVLNASASAPLGLYAVTPGTVLVRGDTVVAFAPFGARRLAAERHYLPINVPMVKRVRAVPGDRICAIGGAIMVEGRRVVERRAHDAAGRPMPWWTGCMTLKNGAVLLLNDVPASFDGRYFGPTRVEDVIGTATPIWVR